LTLNIRKRFISAAGYHIPQRSFGILQNQNMKTATVIGSTGLIGSYLVNILLQDEYFEKLRIIVRRPVTLTHPKLEISIIDFEDRTAFRKAIEGSDVIFSAIGTTQKKVKGDASAYRKIDFDITVNAAALAKETGCPQFLFVSSVGADPSAKNFYLKLKGEIEEAVIKNGPSSISIFRPSMLMGDRKEKRMGESLGKVLMQTFSFLIPTRYKIIHAEKVAQAMVKTSKTKEPGVHYYDYSKMN
jgi:uncharacterized protein YbjT (DUF2867 family)